MRSPILPPRRLWISALVVLLSVCAHAGFAQTDQPQSRSIGTPENGRLENGVGLPRTGTNFSSYSDLGWLLRRQYVHATVRDIVLAAYERMAAEHPDAVFVLGESGWPEGGRFRPHKTHQNGTSVDFMVPVRNAAGNSVPLPTSALNKWGYNLEFGNNGRCDDLRIDFEAMGAHVLALADEAEKRGYRLRRIIFDPELRALLAATPAGRLAVARIPFSKSAGRPRHDEHYHIDFVPDNLK